MARILTHQFDKNDNINENFNNSHKIKVDEFTKQSQNDHKGDIEIIKKLGIKIRGFDGVKFLQSGIELRTAVEERYNETRNVGHKTESDLKTELRFYIQDLFEHGGRTRIDCIEDELISKCGSRNVDRDSLHDTLKMMIITDCEIISNPLNKGQRKYGLNNKYLKAMVYAFTGQVLGSHALRKYTTHFKRLNYVFSLTDAERKVLRNNNDEAHTRTSTHYKELQKHSELLGNAFVRFRKTRNGENNLENKFETIFDKIIETDFLPKLSPQNKKKQKTKKTLKRKQISPMISPSKDNPPKKQKLQNDQLLENQNNNQTLNNENEHKEESVRVTPMNLTSPAIRTFENLLVLSPKYSLNVIGTFNGNEGYIAIIIQTIPSADLECNVSEFLPHVPRSYLRIKSSKPIITDEHIEKFMTESVREQLDLNNNNSNNNNSRLCQLDVLPTMTEIASVLVYNELFRNILLNPVISVLPDDGEIAIIHKIKPDNLIHLRSSLCTKMELKKKKNNNNMNNKNNDTIENKINEQTFAEIASEIKTIRKMMERVEILDVSQYYEKEFGDSHTSPQISMSATEKKAYWMEKYEAASDQIKDFIKNMKTADDAKKTEEFKLEQLNLFGISKDIYGEMCSKYERYKLTMIIALNDESILELYEQSATLNCSGCGFEFYDEKGYEYNKLIKPFGKCCIEKTFKNTKNKTINNMNEKSISVGCSCIVFYPKKKAGEQYSCAEIMAKFSCVIDKKESEIIGVAFMDNQYTLHFNLNDKKSKSSLKNMKIIQSM